MEMVCNHGIILLFIALPLSVVAFANSKPTTVECCDATRASLRGKNVILTGASSGLGKSLAFQLAKCEVGTLVLSGRNLDELQKVKSTCEEIGDSMSMSMSMSTPMPMPSIESHGKKNKMSVQIVPCDLSDETSVDHFSNEAMSICREKADILILCGGISSRSSFLETGKEVDKMLMQVNYLSGSAIAKRVVPSMIQSEKGNIIWVSSLQGLLGTPFRTSYAASKFAVQGYCEALRAELTTSGVQISCISPGYIKTNLSRGAIKGDGSKHGQMDDTTAKGADPDQIASEILDSVIDDGKTDFICAATLSAKVALILKFFAPSLLEKLLVKRYQKSI